MTSKRITVQGVSYLLWPLKDNCKGCIRYPITLRRKTGKRWLSQVPQSTSRHRARLWYFGYLSLPNISLRYWPLPNAKGDIFYSVAPLFLICYCSQWLAKRLTPLLIPNQGVKLGKNSRNSSVCIISWCSSLCQYNKHRQATLVPIVFRICGCNHTYLCVTSVGIFTRWHCLYLHNKLQALDVLYVRYVSIYYWPFFSEAYSHAAANIVLRIPSHPVRYPQIYVHYSTLQFPV